MPTIEHEQDVVRYTYRLRVKPRSKRGLQREWYKALWIWNECVSRARRREWFTDKDLTQHRRWHDWLWDGSVVVGQQMIRRFNTSQGPHKFKSRKTALPSLNYTKRGFSIKDGNQLSLANGITARIVMSRELPSEPKSVLVSQDSLGHWYASFTVTRNREPAPAATMGPESALGLDNGVSRIMTASDRAFDLEHPEHGKKAAAELARAQRKMARRKPKRGQKASRGYKAAKRAAAKCHKKVARQRQDGHRKWARSVCVAYERIALEDFKPAFLAKSTMARKAADAGIGSAKRELVFMAEKFGRNLALVNPAYTTMTCSGCDTRTKDRLPLHQRVFECAHCGLIMDRDENAANVMVTRAGFVPAGIDEVRPVRDQVASALVLITPSGRSEPGIP